MNDSRQQLLHILKTLGPRSTSSLANRLEMTLAGARKHLKLLEQEKLVASSGIAGGVGRPDMVWRLTKTGHDRFPDTHDSLTLDLIGSIRSVFGEAGLDKLIAARESETTKRYAHALGSAGSLRQKVERLAELRSEEGYMAQAEQIDDRTWRLAENHCPVCAAASVCQGLCRSELAVFRQVLGKSVTVERDEYLLDGARRCSYLIRSLVAAPARAAGS
ncbi:helix-turn-helix domain-containing protein [Anderseniella sp. Alg231-50]|uniref:helix-turn-helix domain-containing protein n=1 Tax=Anderseniella sp. Alg231-50 TaxID=1922226 RepID=UPI000D550BAC